MSDERRFVIRPGARQANEAAWIDLQSAVKSLAEIAFSKNMAVEIVAREKKRSRSLAQLRLYWLWVKNLKDCINESQGQSFSDTDVHEWLKERFLDSRIVEIQGTPVRARKSTSDLTVETMTEYLEQVDWFGAQIGCQLPHPEDEYHLAMGRFD